MSDIIDKEVSKMIVRAVILGLIFIAIAGVLIYFLAKNSILIPINKLMAGVNLLGRGILDSRIELKSQDELGELAQPFNNMAQNIKDSTVSINALQREQKRFEDVAVNSGDWIWEIDVKGRYTYSSPVVEQILGYKPKEVIDQFFYNFLHPEDRERLGREMVDVFNRKEKFKDNLIRKITKDGKVVIIETTGVPLLTIDGRLLGYRGADHDITERKQAEEELKVAYDQLKKTQAQLVQSSKMASVGLLAGGVAHEINNPLTGVLNNVQLIRMMSDEGRAASYDEFKELLQVIEESALRCKKITQSLLDFSHASKGMYHPIYLEEVIEKVILLINHELNLQNVIIKKDFEPKIPYIFGDAQLLQQVIFDLVSNARWAIKKKGDKEQGTVILKTQHEKSRNMVSVSIIDNGIGIPKENLNRIFEPFFTTKPVGEGTGLGLSIVYSIIQSHRGTIEVDSELHKGSAFKISFPVPQGAELKEFL